MLSFEKNNILKIILCLFCTAAAGSNTVLAIEKQNSADMELWMQPAQKSNQPDENLSSALHRMLMGTLVVVLLGTAALWASKKVMPRLTPVHGRQIKIVETVYLGSRRTLHLLEINGRQILIGCTNEQICRLGTFNKVPLKDLSAVQAKISDNNQ